MMISNRHCALMSRGNRVFVHDFTSTNGTFVNGCQVVKDTEVRDNDNLRVGPLEFQVRIECGIQSDSDEFLSDDTPAAVDQLARTEEHNAAKTAVMNDMPNGSAILKLLMVPTAPVGETKANQIASRNTKIDTSSVGNLQ
jgi:pSer/pThr/pTyr-binding forkhead associated (FHA) protein